MLKVTDVTLGPLENPQFIHPVKMFYTQDGNKKNWEVIDCGDAVSCIIYNTSRNVLVCVKQFRPSVYLASIPKDEKLEVVDTLKYPATLGVCLEFCGGLMDKNKSFEVTAAEEVLEEVGYQVDPSTLEKVQTFRSSVGGSGELHTLYYVEVTDDMKVNEGGGIEDEQIEIVELSIDECKQLLKSDYKNFPPDFLYGLLWFITNKCSKS